MTNVRAEMPNKNKKEWPRIVSLLASGTELVCALGLKDQLVGRSHECDFPEWVKQLPAVSRPTFSIEGDSAAIDRRVREKLRAGEPLYEIDRDLLERLAPDLVITQSHCAVCAVSPSDLSHGAVPAPSETGSAPVVALQAGTLAGILDGFRSVARAVGREREGEALIAELQRRSREVRAAVQGLEPRSVVCLEWLNPPFTMGNWGPEIVEAAGGTPLLGPVGAHSSAVTWSAIHEADPDLLVIAPCGFSMDRTKAELPEVWRREAADVLSGARAVRTGRVFVADGNRFFNRSGPSAFETIEILAEMVHPERFAPVHRGAAWMPFPVT